MTLRRLLLTRSPLLLIPAVIPTAAEPVPPTRTVNSYTEPAAHTRTVGPAWVCFDDHGFALAAGEMAYADYIGIHSVGWRIVGPRGQIVVTESEAWRVPDGPGQLVPDPGGRRILRYDGPDGIRYMIWSIIESAGPRPVPAILVKGPGLTGTGADQAILQRIERRPLPTRCRFRILRIRLDGE